MNVLIDEDFDIGVGKDTYNRTPTQIPRTPPGPIASFFRRVVIGVPVVGVVSLVQMLWTMSMLTPFHFFTRLRGGARNNRRDRSKDLTTIIILIAIIAGAVRYVKCLNSQKTTPSDLNRISALWKVYQLTEKAAKRVLLRAENAILEVN